MTSRELIGELIGLKMELQYLPPHEIEETEPIINQIKVLEKQLVEKVDNINHFIVELKTRRELCNAEVTYYKEEIDRLKAKDAQIKSIDEYLTKVLLPNIIREVGKDNVLETPTTRFKLYQSFGKVEIDEGMCPREYIKIKQTEYVDKKQAREDAKKAYEKGEKIPGINISKVDRIRRT